MQMPCWRPWEPCTSEKLKLESDTPTFEEKNVEDNDTSHETPNQNLIMCDFCPTVFKRLSEMKRHVALNHSRQREKCKICFRVFTRKDNLARHMKLAHGNDGKNVCKFCSKPMSRKDAVQRHESTCLKNPKKVEVDKIPSTSSSSSSTMISLEELKNTAQNIRLPARLRLKMERK